MALQKTIGIMTSGGDCAGLNTAIHAAALAAIEREGWRVFGIFDGSLGLLERPLRYVELTAASVAEFPFRSGGTALGSINHGDPLHYPTADGRVIDRSAEFAAGARELGLDALIVIGGDGSMRILSALCRQAGLAMVGIPKTIDNDVPGTELAIGFSTAVQVVSDAIDRLQPTAASHHRVMVLEVMGREAGHIALHGGIAGGADAIVLPELGFDADGLSTHLRQVLTRRRHALLVVAEGVELPGEAAGAAGATIARRLGQTLGIEARCTVLGHLQRGGAPDAQDRLLASAFGVHAVSLLSRGLNNRMVCWRQGRVDDVALEQVTVEPQRVRRDHPMIAMARQLGIHLGEA